MVKNSTARMLHVLVMGAGWPPPDVFITRRLQALVAAGAQITVAAPCEAPEADVHMPGIRLLALEDPRDRSFRALQALSRLLLNLLMRRPADLVRLWRIAGRYSNGLRARCALYHLALQFAHLRPDVIHFEWNQSAIEYEWMCDYFVCPTVISCRGRQVNIWPHLPGREDFVAGLQRTFAKAAAVHCVSASIREEAVRCGLDPRKAWVIHTAVDPSFHCPARDPSVSCSPVHLIMVGAAIWRKGYEYALLALHRLLGQGYNVCLDIIGRGDEKDRIDYTAEDLQIHDRVRFLGPLSPTAVRDALQNADIFVLASLSEGIANVVIEAMACSLPVVTTDCGGMREAVTDGVEGFIVPTRDPEAMAEAIRCLIDDRHLRVRMGQAGRARALRDFSPVRQAQQFLTLYESLCAGT
jgi:colanic acid/amylovoran biosynthesis glycosyltransferase